MENNLTMNKLYIIFVLVVASFSMQALMQAQDVHYTLTNPRNVDENGTIYHMVDVLTFSNSGFKLGSGQLYFNYDTTAFGPNAYNNGNLQVIIPDGSILNTTLGQPPLEFSFYGDIVANDNTYNRFSYSWQHDFSSACLFDENVNYYTDVLFTLKFKFKPGQSNVDPGICFEGSAVYIDQTYTACGPVDCNTSNCFAFPGIQLVADFYSCNSACHIVYSTLDSGPGTLRDALSCTAAGDTILFAPNLRYDSIQLTSAELILDKDIHIVAKEDLSIHVNGNDVNRVFDVLINNTAYIEGIHITPGSATQGGTLRNNGVLILKGVTIHGTGSPQDSSLIQNQMEIIIEGTTRVVKQ